MAEPVVAPGAPDGPLDPVAGTAEPVVAPGAPDGP